MAKAQLIFIKIRFNLANIHFIRGGYKHKLGKISGIFMK